MQRLLWIATLFLGPMFFFLFEGDTLLGQSLSTPDGNLVLVGGTIYPSPTDDPILDGVVLIQDGKIVAVGNRKSIEARDRPVDRLYGTRDHGRILEQPRALL